MRTTLAITLLASDIALASVQAANAASKQFTYRNYSRAQFVKIANQICGPHGNHELCCRINDGIWHTQPPPGHCLYM
jgi:hypothetical protein